MTRSLHTFSAIDVFAWMTAKAPARVPMIDGLCAETNPHALAARCACP